MEKGTTRERGEHNATRAGWMQQAHVGGRAEEHESNEEHSHRLAQGRKGQLPWDPPVLHGELATGTARAGPWFPLPP